VGLQVLVPVLDWWASEILDRPEAGATTGICTAVHRQCSHCCETNAVLCGAVLCGGMLCCAVLNCAELCCAVLCCAELCCAALCGAVLPNLWHAEQCSCRAADTRMPGPQVLQVLSAEDVLPSVDACLQSRDVAVQVSPAVLSTARGIRHPCTTRAPLSLSLR
jgi:hypothetical protein